MRRAGFSIVLAVLAIACDRAPPTPARSHAEGAPSRGKRPAPAPARTPARTPAPPAAPGCPKLAPAAPTAAPAEPAPAAVSSIAVNLAVPLAAIQPEIDRLIPNLSDPAWPETHKVDEGMCATWYFDRKPARLKMDGDQLQITIPGSFGMIADPHTDIFGCSRPYASCGNKTTGQAPLPIEIRLSAAPQLARNYRLSAALHNAGTALLAPCQLGGVVNATPTIQSIIDGQIAQQLAGINQAIAA